jgi:signal transduction histidine kinase
MGAGAAGRGFANMRSRAVELGGELRIESAEPGTVVSLWLPLSRSS